VAAAGRIDGSAKSARLRRTVPISCTARKCDAAPCVFTVPSGGTGRAGGASALCLSSRGWHGTSASTGTGTAYPVHVHVHVRFRERFTAPAPCQVTALRYHVLHCHERFTAPTRAAVEVKAHWARQVGMVCSFPLFGSIDLPLRNLLSETSMSALQCFYRLGQANVYGKKIQGRNQDPKPHVA
jgi:hypothetical protein